MADEAVSGTKTDKREDFNRMLSDCRKGRIDKVLVKSLSRFSRNTKDCLASLRELMSLGVTVQFEKENIDTETLTTEFLVSVFGALAQQESVSISENGRQGFRRRMELGQFITTKPPYGYRLKGSGSMEIIRSEAELVRWVFDAYLSGNSVGWIVNDLISRGVQEQLSKSVLRRYMALRRRLLKPMPSLHTVWNQQGAVPQELAHKILGAPVAAFRQPFHFRDGPIPLLQRQTFVANHISQRPVTIGRTCELLRLIILLNAIILNRIFITQIDATSDHLKTPVNCPHCGQK